MKLQAVLGALLLLTSLAALAPTAAAEGATFCSGIAPLADACEGGNSVLLGENIAAHATTDGFAGDVRITLSGPEGSFVWTCFPGGFLFGFCIGPAVEGNGLNIGQVASMHCDALPYEVSPGVAAGPAGPWGCQVNTA